MSELTDPAMGKPGRLSIERDDRPAATVLAVRGDIDLGTAPRVTAAVSEALTEAPKAVVLDLTEVDFLASAGLTLLVMLHRDMPDGISLRIVASGRATLRPIQLTGLEQSLPLYPTLEAALAAE